LTTSHVVAYSDSQWDCNLANDGKTWDCSAGTKPLAKTTETPQPTKKQAASSPTGNIDVAKAKTQQNKPSVALVPRVQLTRQSINKPAKKQPTRVKSLANNGSWDCQAGSNGAWDCSQTSAPSTIASSTYVETAAETGLFIDYTSSRQKNAILFEQMVQHLAVNPWDTCEVSTDEQADANAQDLQKKRLNAQVNIEADYAEILNQDNASFNGDVLIKRADQLITADHVNYQNKQQIATASGDVLYQQQGFSLHSEQAQLQLNDNTGKFDNNQFIIESTHARASTKTTEMVNRNITRSNQVVYTTCAPSVNDWELQAETLELNNETGRGTGRNVWVEVFDMPVLYTPYISFPIDDRRQSGILAPTFGNSDTTGTDLAVPYYWNIAPNYDATITPRIMSSRGFMLGGEFRYLSNNSEGKISAEALNDTDTGEFRGQFSYQDESRWSSRLTSDIDIKAMSDDDYLEDFGNSLSISSDRYLKSHASLNYRADNWTLQTKIDNYDSIDEAISKAARPHRRLPQVLFNLREQTVFDIAKVNMRNEFVYFDHSSETRAKRIDIQPSISVPLRNPASFITPKLSVRHTNYRLDQQAAGTNNHIERTLPILSLDSGLFFERDLKLFGGLVQTLEPRAYYLYVPYENQDDIPIFDSSEYDFSYNQLFRENRFSGADRVGDANQLTLAVTSRFIQPSTGKERLRASVGTIVYFDDLDVRLNPGSTPISKNSSDIVAEVSAKMTDNWSARSALQYDPHAGITEKATLGLHYRDGANRLFNATYRSRYAGTLDSSGNSNDIEQTDISFKLPINKEWSTVGRWNYSEEHNVSLDTFIGLEKDTCCWRMRVIARQYVNDALDEEPKQGIFFQFELKGLTSFGQKLDSILEENILGYQIPKQ